MANSNANVNVKVGFSVDKSGLNEMQSLFQRIANQAQNAGSGLTDGLKKAGQTAQTLDGILEKTFNTDLGTLNVTKFNQELKKNGLTLKDVKNDLSKVGSTGTQAYNRLSQAILGTNLQLKQSNKLLDDMAESMSNTIKWGITSSIFNNITNSIQKAVDYSRKLNSSLNDIRIVTDKSAESMEKFADKANQGAIALGASTLDYTQASLIYYQQGLEDAEVQARAETTLKAANVTGQSGEEVSEQLTAVWNGYKVTAAETELYVDKLAAVAASTASDLEELSKGMSKVASAANSMGVDVDQLNAQLATIISVTKQAPENVGTALKTIYARLGDLKADGTDEFGVSLGEVSSQLASMGIQVLDQEGNLRDMGEVIEEVAGKWNGWTEAQRQAAAVAMAGKRQYNNLIALFDNWDMYTASLETSANAMGTLQKQQDIYMESTAAKLQKLRTTWQGVYQDFIIDDEINSGIDAITDLVKVLDNFVASFGGGIKTIIGFGAIFANIFNNQITNAINNAINRQQVYQQNLEALQLKAQAIENGTAKSTGNSVVDAGVAENTKIQLEYAKQIYAVRQGLTTEQYNELTGMQQQIGLLEEQKKIIEEETYQLAQNAAIKDKIEVDEKDIKAILEGQVDAYEKIINNLGFAELESEAEIENREFIVRSYQEEANELKTISGLKNFVVAHDKELNHYGKERINDLFKEVEESGNVAKARYLVNNYLRKYIQSEEEVLAAIRKEADGVKKVGEQREKIAKLNSSQNNIKQQANDMLNAANKAKSLGTNVTMITSALGGMAMAWSSVNSLMDTINNKEISFGDKALQVITVAGMGIPMLISNINKLNEALGITTKATEYLTLAKERDIIVSQASGILDEKATLDTHMKRIAHEAYIKIKEKENLTEEQTIFLEKLESASLKEKIGLLQTLTKEELVALGVEEKQAEALMADKLAMDAFNTSMLANPLVILIGALVAGAAAYAFFRKRVEEARKSQLELNKAIIESNKEKIKEADDNRQLINSYQSYVAELKKGTITKTEFADKTQELIDKYDLENGRLLALTGNYQALGKAIDDARSKELEESTKAAQENLDKANFNARITNAEKNAQLDFTYMKESDSHYKYQYGGQFGLGDEDSQIKKFGQAALAGYSSLYYRDDSDGTFAGGVKGLGREMGAILTTGALAPVLGALAPVIGGNLFLSNKAKDAFLQDPTTIEGDLSTPNGMISVYQAMEKRFNDKNTSDEEKKELQEQLENLSEDYQTALESINAMLQNEVEQSFLNQKTIFSQADITYEDFKKTYENELNKEKSKLDDLLENGEISQEEYDRRLELSKNYLNSLVSQYDGASKRLAQYDFVNSLTETFKDNKTGVNIEEWIKKNIYTDPEKGVAIAGYLDLSGNETQEQLDAELERATAKYDKAQRDERIGKLEEAKNLIVEGKDQDAIQAALSGLQDIENGYTNLYGIQEQGNAKLLDTINDYYNFELDHIRENSEEYIKANNDKIKSDENRLKELEDYKKSHEYKILSDEEKEKTEAEIAEIEAEIKNLTNENYQIQLSISDEITDKLVAMADNVMALSDAISSASAGIGENFTVAAEGVQKLADTFPELFENAEVLENGVVQLKEETVKAVLGADAEMLASDDELVKNKIKNRIKELDIKIDELDQQIEIAQKVANGEISIDDAKNEAMEGGLTGFGDFLTESYNNWVDGHAEMCDEEANDHHAMIKSMIEDVNKLGSAWEKARETQKNGGKYEATDIADESSYTGGDYEDIVAGITKERAEEIKAATDKITEESKALGQAMVESLTAIRDSDIKNRAKLYAAISEMSAKSADANKKLDDAISGKGNKDKKNQEKKIEDEFDRYWELKKAIDAVDRSLNKLSKDQENLYGEELADSLMQTNQLLEQQAANYARLAEEQRKEASELQGVLSGMGVTFDASGAITNYAAATSAALAQYNEAIAKYNAGLIDESSFKIYEKQYELFKKQLERYDQLFYTEMKETQEKLEEIERQKKANNLKAWEVKLQVKLEMKELKREWNNFLSEINSDFKRVYKDLRAEVETMKKNAKTYGGKSGTIMTEINALDHVEKEIDKMKSGGISSEYESISQAQEKLKELNQKLIDDAKAFHDLIVQAWEAYYEGIDQVKDQLDDIIDRYDKINDRLEYQKQLVELIYGPEAYHLMDTWYKAAEHNSLSQLDSLVKQRDEWKKLFEEAREKAGASMTDTSKWTKEMMKYYENWQEAQGKLYDQTVEYINLLKDDYTNAVKSAIKELEMYLTSGKGLTSLQEDWERRKAASDKYLDEVEKSYGILSFENKVDKSIDATEDIKAQQKLAKLREQELKDLREKKKLTQYDLDAANARLKIAEAEIALEEAQNNKNSMKVVRNEEGNWSYQYVAEEEDVATKRQELLDSYNDLYELAKNAYEENLSSMMALTEEYLQRKEEIETSMLLDDTQRAQALAELEEWYYNESQALAEENELYKQDMTEAGFEIQLTAYEQDHEIFSELTKEKRDIFEEAIKEGMVGDLEKLHIAFKDTTGYMDKDLRTLCEDIKKQMSATMSETLPIWTSGAQGLIDLWNKDDGKSVKAAITKANDAITAAAKKYEDQLKQLEKVIGETFGDLEDQINANIEATDELDGAMERACQNGEKYIDDLRKAAEDLEEQWNRVKDAIEDAIKKLEEYLQMKGQAGAGTNDGFSPDGGNADTSTRGKDTDKDSEGSKTTEDNNSKSSNEDLPYYVVNARGDSGKLFKHTFYPKKGDISALDWQQSHPTYHGVIVYHQEDGRVRTESFKTGGYTGAWEGANIEENGRLAMLHQKELVLNADDTQNLLNAVGIVRALGDFIAATTAGLGNISAPSIRNAVSNSSNTYGDVIIQAEFPNASDVEEIREAILSLPNLAAQYFANQNTR